MGTQFEELVRIGPFRDASGRLLPNVHFPDMKGLADYIHAKGLKAGLYTSPGPTTCGGYQYQQRDQEDMSLELRLTSPDDQRLRWLAGVYFADIERHAILSTLEAMGGSTSKAADVLQISVRKIQFIALKFSPKFRPPTERLRKRRPPRVQP